MYSCSVVLGGTFFSNFDWSCLSHCIAAVVLYQLFVQDCKLKIHVHYYFFVLKSFFLKNDLAKAGAAELVRHLCCGCNRR